VFRISESLVEQTLVDLLSFMRFVEFDEDMNILINVFITNLSNNFKIRYLLKTRLVISKKKQNLHFNIFLLYRSRMSYKFYDRLRKSL